MWKRCVLFFVVIPQIILQGTYVGYSLLLIHLNRKFPVWFAKRALNIDRSVNLRPTFGAVLKNLLINVTVVNSMMIPLLLYISPTNLPVSVLDEKSLGEVLLKLVGCFVFTETWFYWIHRGLHHKNVYKRIHAIHHEATHPYGFVTNYSHIIEFIVLNVPTIAGGPTLVMFSWLLLWLWHFGFTIGTVTLHSGYELIPFVPTRHHDNHHLHLKGNYGLFTSFWDRVCGTYID